MAKTIFIFHPHRGAKTPLYNARSFLKELLESLVLMINLQYNLTL